MKKRFEAFHQRVSACELCHGKPGIHVPRPDRIPDKGRVKVLILGEQPDREVSFGTGCNGLDNPGPEMERLRGYLAQSGVDLDEVLYATCVFCVPRDELGRPGRPALGEVKNCTRHLVKLIELAQPRVIVPLGHTAVQALQWVFRDWKELRQFILNYDVGTVVERRGMAVYPLYHTSCSTVKARPEGRQARDWARIPSILESQERREAPTG
jgi:uracil-DNA glycosylase family 4